MSAGGAAPDEVTGPLAVPVPRVRAASRRLRSVLSARVVDELVPDEGEFVVDEVRHHWVLFVLPVTGLVAAASLGLVALSIRLPWLAAAPAATLAGYAGWRMLADHMDRFVITNLRVFRVQGVISRRTSTMPIQRILDITVTTPVLGRLLGFGHFVFESAAQEQGLRDIRYIGSPHQRDLTMQRVIQRAGLRGGLRGDSVPRDGTRPKRRRNPPRAGGASGASGASGAGAPGDGHGREGDHGATPAPGSSARHTSRRRRVGFTERPGPGGS